MRNAGGHRKMEEVRPACAGKAHLFTTVTIHTVIQTIPVTVAVDRVGIAGLERNFATAQPALIILKIRN